MTLQDSSEETTNLQTDIQQTSSTQPVLTLGNFRVVSRGRPLSAIINLSLYPGELHLLQGPVGAGKSIITEVLAGIARPGISYEGEIKYSFSNTKIAFRSQDPRLAALATDRVGPLLKKADSQSHEDFISQLQEDWGLDYSRIRRLRFRDLSFSEKMSLLSARVLTEDSDVLIIDGFGEELDPRFRRRLKELLLKKLKAGTTVLISSRRPLGSGLTPTTTTHLTASGTSSEEVMPLVSQPINKQRSAQAEVLLEVDRLRIKKGARSIFPSKAAARPVNGASLYLRHYETFAILGPSGSGKSKLLESIAGLHRPLSGRILLNGHDVTFARGRRLKRLRQTVQIVFQEASAVLDKDRKVHEILNESLKIAGQKNIVLDLELERLGLPSELANAWADQLSPGEAQLVDVCRRLILKPELLIIDEPRVAGIDVDGGLLFGVLRSFLSAKRSVLIATSDPSVARSADRVGILLGGRIIEFGSSRRVLETPSHPATRAFLRGERLPLIDPRAHPTGCTYANFCDKQEFPRCQEKEPALAPHPSRAQQGSRQRVACFHPLD